MTLKTPITQAGLTYKMKTKQLERLNISTVEDLLFHIPHRYEDLSLICPIDLVQPGEIVTIRGSVSDKTTFQAKRFSIQKITVTDSSGSIDCIWFNQKYIMSVFSVGDIVNISGKASFFKRKVVIQTKQYEHVTDSASSHTGRLVAIYPETYGITSKWFRNRIAELLESTADDQDEYLPVEIVKKYGLISFSKALHQIHRPDSVEEAEHARRRLAFDELFTIQLSSQKLKRDWDSQGQAYEVEFGKHEKEIEKLLDKLPFSLTGAQNKALSEIKSDIQQKKPMNRLLEGDVGSGKTVVAAIVSYLFHLNGLQSAIMAPTEILANQHYDTIKDLLKPFGVEVLLYTSQSKKKIEKIPKFDIAIGTHALLDEKLNFNRLGFVVIDEQQRFGVRQRSILRDKGTNPHFLTMTATPIPRTVALTMYGDLDVSYLNEMPKGRVKVRTWFVPEKKRIDGYNWIRNKILEGKEHHSSNQIFVVCPFIEDSETQATVKAAKSTFENLKSRHFSEFSVGLLHGKMKSKEKDEVLNEFKKERYDILVATPLVEVGIDIPNATIMMIEAADRFGLAQLHQLRGRVGRRDKESFCLLFADNENEHTVTRLKHLESVHSGSELAEIDLKLRGPGDVFGTKQHGVTDFKIAKITDFDLIEKTKKESEKYFKTLKAYPGLQARVESTIIQKITPD